MNIVKNPYAWCGGEVRRFHARNNKPYRFCSPECDKANMGVLAKIRFSKPEKFEQMMRDMGVKP